ncbi:hypothetical protein C6A36_01515, partial [Desulfobacteraceae bacterium SEEP-SAG10]
MDDQEKIPFTEHLEELRKRLIVCFIAVGIGFVLSYGFKEKLFQILTRPLISVMQTGDKLIFTGLPEAFFTYLKVAFLSGIILATPVILNRNFHIAVALIINEKYRSGTSLEVVSKSPLRPNSCVGSRDSILEILNIFLCL